MRRLVLGLALAAAPACGLATSGLGGASGAGGGGAEPPDGGSPDTGDHDAGRVDAGHTDAGHDAGMPVGDSLPPSAVSFFQGTTCPTGWVPYTAGNGFFLVPTVATYPGVAVGTPLASGEDRTHTHAFQATFGIDATSYVGISGCCNGGVGPSGNLTLSGTTDPISTGLPYVQLLVCRKNAPALPGSAPLPHGLQMFFDMSACPIGWQQTTATQGRLIVGLPQGAPQDVTFGGPPLSSEDGGPAPVTHAHGATVTLTTTSYGIALGSGCCAGGYAANATYTSTGDTDAGDTGLPYLELLGCETE